MRVVAFSPREHLPEAVAVFTSGLRALRRRVPALPVTFTRPQAARELLGAFLTPERTLVALEGKRVVGYLGWAEYERFRGVARRTAYSPEYGHGVRRDRALEIQRALYRAAAARWWATGCRIHCLTVLAGDPGLERSWFESGFGMLGQDALRPLDPAVALARLPAMSGTPGVVARRAALADVPVLARLDAEHCRHYAAPPVLMMPLTPATEDDLARFLTREPNSIWLAEIEGRAQGFLRFEPESHGAARISLGPGTISITGAFTRPAWRGRGAATAMLAGAVADYAGRGFERMAVDYETINPEALAFWPRHFRVVASSYLRVPERS
jgi:ribosomal protein S18 acetylase RimI-like enzyme